jgi:nitrite reductase/ring-hydroxylating ferredoxin subunit
MGVSMFIFAAIHGVFSIIQFHTQGNIQPLASVFLSNTKYLTISQFPFQVLGFFALIIFFLLAATSHDFWLKNLTPGIWKALHMLVYLAYALIVLHIALGILQYENKPLFWGILLLGVFTITTLHIAAGMKQWKALRSKSYVLEKAGFYRVCPIDEIPDGGGKEIDLNGENIAIFKYDNHVSAVSNICRHQMGPLSEGRIIEGCITCPWHGYQYLPQNGQSPPPFTEKLETYETRIVDNAIWVNPSPQPEGTYVTPSNLP